MKKIFKWTAIIIVALLVVLLVTPLLFKGKIIGLIKQQANNTLNADISNSMIVPFFFQGRSGEIIKLFKKGEGDEKTRAREILVRLDVTNANTYKQELK